VGLSLSYIPQTGLANLLTNGVPIAPSKFKLGINKTRSTTRTSLVSSLTNLSCITNLLLSFSQLISRTPVG